MTHENESTYLGDGLYARDDGDMITLWTERKHGSHYVALEPQVFEALLQFAINIGWLQKGHVLQAACRQRASRDER